MSLLARWVAGRDQCCGSAPTSRWLWTLFARRWPTARVFGLPRRAAVRFVRGVRVELEPAELGRLSVVPAAAALRLREGAAFFAAALGRRLRVVVTFFVVVLRCALGRARARSPATRAPLLLGGLVSGTPRPFRERAPPSSSLTVARARRPFFAFGGSRDPFESSRCSALRFGFTV